ncbi:tyrosine-type recombinase/integrase [Staphylococcus warneri]|uniref:site-specific integrase n=1 Tax=Staphylococcus warneri TaxID=1292 RepID=UPI000D1D42DD|nr:tyrosine-type recombinase/integrase [Staphylococcus warneri]PTI21368.1 site-specific integrase [Staphylococcus warneri]PTI26681.1 site-specific integrase [Staphylococcus warneri]RIM98763.1 site-specific integrase [Staphylococcus warneri]RIN06585.1 site-specific integrase [Staphylococcus warneri]
MPVYKDENTGKWYFSTRYKDVYGNNKRKLQRGFERKKDAKFAESEFIQNIKFGYSDNQPFETIFYDRLKNENLSTRSIEKRTTEYNTHIKAKFGNTPIGKITTTQCTTFRNYLINDSGLSVDYARSVWAGFKAVINYAKKYYKLLYDPTLPVTPIPRTKPQAKFITREEFDEKVEKITNETSRNLTKLLFYSGLRIGEALALQWKDYDFEKGELNINKKLNLSQKTIETNLKKESSKGIIPIPKHIRKMLNDMYDQDSKNYKYFTENYFIFGGYEPLIYITFSGHFKKAFPNLRIHHLRHSYASYLINNGVDMYVLMELMRHSNITETIQTYSHLYTDKKQQAMRIFE